jgi:hypothetical protein
MVRIAAAIVLALHGLIHLIGFVVPWRLAEPEGFTYQTTVLAGAVEIGDLGIRLVGLAWLAVGAAFVVIAIGLWRAAPWVGTAAVAVALVSLTLSLLGLPEAGAGIVVNLAILAVAAHALRQPERSLQP